MSDDDVEQILADTRGWVRRVVLGLDLCPFAAAPWAHGLVRVEACVAPDVEGRLTALWTELDRLFGTPAEALETTLLVVPHAPARFDDFLAETDLADAVCERAGYGAAAQLVTFHPGFRFATEAEDDPANLVNQSPYPMWHVLRSDSLAKVSLRDPTLGERVSRANRDLLRALPPTALRAQGDSDG